MKIRIRKLSQSSDDSVEIQEIEVPEHTITVELDVMSDTRVRFIVRTPEKK